MNLSQALTGVSSQAQQAFDNITVGAKVVADSTYDATEKSKLLDDLFTKDLNVAKTKEEFKALNELSQQYSLNAVKTAEQHSMLTAGMQGGTDAVREHTEALNKKAEASEKEAQNTDKATEAVEKHTKATKDNKNKTTESTAETKKNKASKKEATTATYQLYDATNLNAEAIDKLNEKAKVWQKVFNRATRSGHIALIDQANRLISPLARGTSFSRTIHSAVPRDIPASAGNVTIYVYV